ncbi:tRNA1(Val) (adenine(37)-N6)-methyltransferase [Methylosinus sp. Sm6]|uniref:tRNA1(Val) (adenine(37)-N6)-methyltransferase n=1 Tax=Methylosinus sp. Sm6 TaxID=2866948 RepID=UPI001C99C17E|nr:methyltransferase [Methylosinus sp. Sm6]MBY6242179.1 methyltransferase [Methylosinus sp. Sm6]
MNVHRATNVPPSSEQRAPRGESFLAGRLRLRQTPRGHRAGTDAVLLAAAATPERRGLVIDAGAGTGAVGLAAALRAPIARVSLIEIDAEAAALARENIAANELTERVRLHEADLVSAASRRAAGLLEEAADLVLTNPPFLDPARSRVSPDPRRALAHVAAGGLEPWLRACLALLRPGGELALIHRADALADCLASLGARVGALRILPVAARAGEPATRILLRGVKGSKAPLALLAPLVLHEADGAFTRDAEALARGEDALPW